MYMKKDDNKIFLNRPKKILFITLGTFFVGIAIVGIIIPILPTTPFLLLSAALYARSSKRFYDWLLNNRLFGKYIKNYREGRGIPVYLKIIVITLLWITISISIVFAAELLAVRILLVIIASGVSIHILKIKTSR